MNNPNLAIDPSDHAQLQCPRCNCPMTIETVSTRDIVTDGNDKVTSIHGKCRCGYRSYRKFYWSYSGFNMHSVTKNAIEERNGIIAKMVEFIHAVVEHDDQDAFRAFYVWGKQLLRQIRLSELPISISEPVTDHSERAANSLSPVMRDSSPVTDDKQAITPANALCNELSVKDESAVTHPENPVAGDQL